MQEKIEEFINIIEENKGEYFYIVANSNISDEYLEAIFEAMEDREVKANLAYLWIKEEEIKNVGAIYPVIRKYVEPAIEENPLVILLNLAHLSGKIGNELRIEHDKEESIIEIPLKEKASSVKTPRIIKERRKQYLK